MSFREQVQEIYEEMSEAAVRWDDRDEAAAEELRSFAKLLKVALKASESSPQPPWSAPPPFMGKRKEDDLEIKVKEQARKEEANAEIMTELVGGPLEGDNVMRPAPVPIGARTRIAGSEYELKEDHRLHFVR